MPLPLSPLQLSSGNVKRPANRQFRKFMGFSHESLRHLTWHYNIVKQAFRVPCSFPRGDVLNPINFQNVELWVFYCLPISLFDMNLWVARFQRTATLQARRKPRDSGRKRAVTCNAGRLSPCFGTFGCKNSLFQALTIIWHMPQRQHQPEKFHRGRTRHMLEPAFLKRNMSATC